jgi:hypothetical protein
MFEKDNFLKNERASRLNITYFEIENYPLVDLDLNPSRHKTLIFQVSKHHLISTF